MNKYVAYILKNISVFNSIAIAILAFSLFKMVTFNAENNNHEVFNALLIVFLSCSIPFLLFDLIMKRVIVNRGLLNIMQFLIVLALCIIFYFKYSDLLF